MFQVAGLQRKKKYAKVLPFKCSRGQTDLEQRKGCVNVAGVCYRHAFWNGEHVQQVVRDAVSCCKQLSARSCLILGIVSCCILVLLVLVILLLSMVPLCLSVKGTRADATPMPYHWDVRCAQNQNDFFKAQKQVIFSTCGSR